MNIVFLYPGSPLPAIEDANVYCNTVFVFDLADWPDVRILKKSVDRLYDAFVRKFRPDSDMPPLVCLFGTETEFDSLPWRKERRQGLPWLPRPSEQYTTCDIYGLQYRKPDSYTRMLSRKEREALLGGILASEFSS